jgi:hypothetical protein
MLRPPLSGLCRQPADRRSRSRSFGRLQVELGNSRRLRQGFAQDRGIQREGSRERGVEQRERGAMSSANKLKLGLSGANCSSGRAVTLVPNMVWQLVRLPAAGADGRRGRDR